MIKIGIECESIEEDTWGIARIVTKLLEELSKRPELQDRFRFHLYFKSHVPDLEYLNNPIFVKRLVRFPFQPFTSFSFYYYIMLPIRLWFERLDLMFFPSYMLPHLFFGKSLVHLTNDVVHEMNSPAQPIRYRIAYKIFSKWAAKHATHIITLSKYSKEELERLLSIPSDRITANYLGIDIREKTDSKNKYEKYILYFGQAFPRRHVKETLQAFARIAPDFPNLKLIVRGHDLYYPPVIDNLHREINEILGRSAVLVIGRVSDVELTSLYSNAILVVYVSENEAFGLPPLEALALGSVPIVADSKLTHELIGENAFFVSKMHDIDAIAVAMREGLTNINKREEIINNGKSITSMYTWKLHTDRFIELCSNLVDRS